MDCLKKKVYIISKMFLRNSKTIISGTQPEIFRDKGDFLE